MTELIGHILKFLSHMTSPLDVFNSVSESNILITLLHILYSNTVIKHFLYNFV